MYQIEIPATVQYLLGVFYRLGMWSDNNTTFGKSCRKLLYFIYFAIFVLSIAAGAYITDDKDESVYLTVVSVFSFLLAYKMWIILWRKNEFMLFVNRIGSHSTNDRDEFIKISSKLNVLMKFIRFFMCVLTVGCIFASVLFPITNEKRLIFNIALPFDRNSNNIAFLIASAFVGVGISLAIVCAIITKMVWYLLYSISLEYEILGNQLRHMGTIRTGTPHLKVSLAAQQQLFYKDFIVAIQTYDKINGYTVMHL